jgi:hypothetical protein
LLGGLFDRPTFVPPLGPGFSVRGLLQILNQVIGRAIAEAGSRSVLTNEIAFIGVIQAIVVWQRQLIYLRES